MTRLLKTSLAASALAGTIALLAASSWRRPMVLATSAALSTAAPAQPPELPRGPDPTRTWTEDATRDHYNGALLLRWERRLGDWVDRDGRRHGGKPFARGRGARQGENDIDVTEMVRAYGGEFRVVGAAADILSREAGPGGPILIVTRGGKSEAWPAAADVGMDSSTFASRGREPLMKLGDGFFVRFGQPADPSIERAVLRFTAARVWSGGRTEVYLPDPRPFRPTMPPVPIGGAGDVVMRLSGKAWRTGLHWDKTADHTRIGRDGSLTAWMNPGSDVALSTIYSIPPAKRRPLMCLRTVMTIHRDWTAHFGGKFPGLANTGQGDRSPDQAGWGGRGADGTRWSARTNRWPHNPANQFADDWIALGTYAYRLNRSSNHGDQVPLAVPVPKGRPFTYDQCVRMNRPGAADGFVAYWLDGEPAGLLDGIVWRAHDGPQTLPSEIWADVYEGGTGYDKTPHGRHTVTLHSMTLSTKRLPFEER